MGAYRDSEESAKAKVMRGQGGTEQVIDTYVHTYIHMVMVRRVSL